MARRVHKDDAHEQTAKIVAQIGLLGDEELQKRLNALPDKVIRRIVPRASELATDSVLADARRRAPEETGLLKESLGKKQKLYRRSGTFVTVVGPRMGFKRIVKVFDREGRSKPRYRNPVNYAHLVEKGTKPHSLRTAGKGVVSRAVHKLRSKNHPGTVARPFISTAYAKNRGRVVQVYRSVIASEIAKVAAEEAR